MIFKMKCKMESNLFHEYMLDWYQINKRKLPFRGSKDPYKIWLSEVMLQQTKVSLKKYTDNTKKYYETHKEENCWSFSTDYNGNNIEFKNGVKEHLNKTTKLKNAVTFEKNEKKYSLCINYQKINIMNNKCGLKK